MNENYEAYLIWFKECGEGEEVGKIKLGKQIEELGFHKTKGRYNGGITWIWQGLGLSFDMLSDSEMSTYQREKSNLSTPMVH